MYPASTKFHSSSDPSSADHSDKILKNSGVARLEFSATYRSEKSSPISPASIARFAIETRASSEYAEVRALSTRSGLRLRAANADAAPA